MSQKARLIIDSWIPLLNYRTQDKEMTKKTMCYLFLVKYDWSMRFHGNRRYIVKNNCLCLQCEAQYPLNYSFPSVATIYLMERNTICAISINKQGSSQQMNVLPNWIKTYLQEELLQLELRLFVPLISKMLTW
uniref:Uncharacterized protein n=1 Tax=Vespula pensylvanica TaxID=30213 RepID=A0A834KIY4_VESPE|nr:hypothetical protein H0235_014438 [Vespula pensylvanica]